MRVIALRRVRAALSSYTREALKLWRVFKRGKPGRRFQARYYLHRRRRFRGEAPMYGRLYNVFGGLAMVTTGLFLSWIVFSIGLWLLAGESLALARLCDRAEVRLRKIGGRIEPYWNALPAPARVLLLLACLAALGYGAYHYLVFVT